MPKKIICIVGTRPEAIKMAPVINALKKEKWVNTVVLSTAQHRQMTDQVLNLFKIVPDIDLNIMQPNQTLPSLTSRLIAELDKVFTEQKPDAVLVQGDTTTVMAASLVCFYHRIPIGHVEAGLRTWDINNPFPEEMNRKVAGIVARWHFAPTASSKANLLKENIPEGSIFVTGNTVIDALLDTAKTDHPIGVDLDSTKRLVLVTSHRRENFGEPFNDICKAIRDFADQNPDVQILYPVHPNPNVHTIAHKLLGNHPQIVLTTPLDYAPFISAMKKAFLIVTDSGGVQEEAPALGKPVLVMRNETERPEAVTEGVVRLVGTDYETLISAMTELTITPASYQKMAKGISPYGDGNAAARIVGILKSSLLQ
jgi:UDP-N-acetylglucosamine 2-epimerase (non-hydrolysing)